MQYLPVVDVLESQTNLSEPVEHVLLTPILKLASILLPILVLILNFSLQISSVCEVHDDAKFSFFGFVNFSKSHDIWVLEDLEYFCFSKRLPPFIFVHTLDVDLLDDGVLLVGVALDQVSCAK